MQINHKKLRELRLKKGLTQEDVAKAIGYESNIGYHYIETGKRRITAERLAQLANLFGVGIEDLFTKDEKHTKNSTNTQMSNASYLKSKSGGSQHGTRQNT